MNEWNIIYIIEVGFENVLHFGRQIIVYSSGSGSGSGI